MTRRPNITFTICAIAALAAGLALTRTGPEPVSSAAPGPGESAAQDPYGGGSAGADPSGAEQPEDQPADPAAGPPAVITIAGFDFGQPLTVAPGTAIAVSNADGAPHTVTAADGSFDTGTIDGSGNGVLTAPAAAGTYAFFCTIHPSMQGSITVTG